MKTFREQLIGKCKHFNGISNKRCRIDVAYDDIANVKELGITGSAMRIPCMGAPAGTVRGLNTVLPCEKYSPRTDAEMQAEADEWERVKGLMSKGLSPCCESTLDTSQVIKTGTYKGHGPRFCSKCKKTVFMV